MYASVVRTKVWLLLAIGGHHPSDEGSLADPAFCGCLPAGVIAGRRQAPSSSHFCVLRLALNFGGAPGGDLDPVIGQLLTSSPVSNEPPRQSGGGCDRLRRQPRR